MKTEPVFFAALLAVAGCARGPEPGPAIRLATTTSVRDTGLLDALGEAFRADGRYTLQAIAVGSGQAMQLGRSGEADILLTHSPEDEARFVEGGWGVERVTFMHNDFVLLGPPADPAGAAGAGTAAEAFRRIAKAGALFVSRADESGTHKRELKLWASAGLRPGGPGYLEAGQGMAGTMSVASEKKAYLLSDRSTYLAMRRSVELRIVLEGDEALLNRYSVILVNPARFPKVNAAGARAYHDFLLSERAKAIIGGFGAERYGRPLFVYDHKPGAK